MRECLQMLSSLNIDYTLFWRELSLFKTEDTESLKGIWDYYGKRVELMGWLKKYSERLHREDSDELLRSLLMRSKVSCLLKTNTSS